MRNDQYSRRAILQAPALAGAQAVLSAQADTPPLRVAHVGVGGRGTLLLRNTLTIPGVQVVAVCDIDPEKARAATEMVAASGGSARQWADFRQMLREQPEIDAVVLATPGYTHKELDVAILDLGKHLYAEKPLALTAADCKAVAAAARSAKGIFQVGLQNRHDRRRQASRKFISEGGLGKLLMCHGIRHGWDLPRNRAWYFDRTKCGDILVDQGIHILDQFTWMIGSHPLRAMGSGGTNLFLNVPPGRTVMDNASVILEYQDDVRVNFSHQFFDPFRVTGIQERVFGSKGVLDIPSATWYPSDTANWKSGPKPSPVQLQVAGEGKDANYLSLSAFVDNVHNGKQPMNNAETAVEATLVALMATRAIYEKRTVTWDEMMA